MTDLNLAIEDTSTNSSHLDAVQTSVALLSSLNNTTKLHFLARGTNHALFSGADRQVALCQPEVQVALAQSSSLPQSLSTG